MWPHIESLKDIFGNTSLISFGNTKAQFTDNKWINIENNCPDTSRDPDTSRNPNTSRNIIMYEQIFISKKLAFTKPCPRRGRLKNIQSTTVYFSYRLQLL